MRRCAITGYESPDGASFTRMAVQPFTSLTLASCPTAISNATCPFYRAQFAIQPVTHTMFIIAVDGQEVSQGISTATDAQLLPANGTPVSWSPVSDIDPTLPTVNGAPTTRSGITECEGATCRELIQGRYDLWISAVPAGSGTQVFVGTRDIYRCDLGNTANCTTANAWVNLTNVYQACNGGSVLSPFAHVHADQHAMSVVATDPNVMFFANDGGVYRSLNGAPGDGCGSAQNPFQSLNANLGPISEFISFAQNPFDPAVLIAGAEHTGTSATTGSLGMHWQAVNGGDGGYSEIDPNPGTAPDGTAVAAGQIWYSENTDISIQQCTSGAACTQGTFGLPPNFLSANIDNSEVGGDAGDFFTPFKLEPQSPDLLFVGTCRLWRGPGAGGASWNGLGALSPMFDYLVTGVPAPASCGGETNIRSIAAGGPSGTVSVNNQRYSVSKVVYVGMSAGADSNGAVTASSGHIFVTRDSTAASPQWSDVTVGSGTGGFLVSDIVVDPKDPTGGTVLVTVTGFGVSHVLKTTDFGAHWTNIAPANVFPDVPADAIALDPNDANTIYVGTDIGMFYTADAGQSWSLLGTGLPVVPITRIRILNGQKLRVSTFGRGAWEIPLNSFSPPQTPPPSANTQFVYKEYHDLLNRDPDYGGWVG